MHMTMSSYENVPAHRPNIKHAMFYTKDGRTISKKIVQVIIRGTNIKTIVSAVQLT